MTTRRQFLAGLLRKGSATNPSWQRRTTKKLSARRKRILAKQLHTRIGRIA